MLAPFIHHSAGKLAAYHDDDLAAKGEGHVGGLQPSWFGQGSALLGLHGPVGRKEFRRLCRNQHPATGQPLTPRQSSKRRVAYDFQVAPPKSVSVMGAVMNCPEVRRAHHDALVAMLGELERLAMTRVRRNGADTDRVTGNVVGVAFPHLTSRDNDPQLHTHCLVFNATFDGEEKGWKALQAGEIFAQHGLLTAVYRSRLLAELHRLGYPTRRTRNGFEIVGVPDEVIALFSKRHAGIDRVEQALGSSGNAKLRQGIARKHREAKASNQSLDQLCPTWLIQLTSPQLARLQAVKNAAGRPVKPKRITPDQALTLAAKHLFERRTVVGEHELLAECLMVGDGQVDLDAARSALVANGAFMARGRFLTTREAVIAEAQAILFVNEGIGVNAPLVCSPSLEAANLSPEQRTALGMLLGSRDRVVALSGPAGAGKSTVVTELRRELDRAGCRIAACAPTTAATKVLRQSGFAAMTLPRLLTDIKRQEALEGAVIVLDEAGLVCLKQLNQLFVIAKQRRCRIILSGDSAQHKSVEAGDAFRILEQESRLRVVRLSTIYRQVDGAYRRTVDYLYQGHHEAALHTLRHLDWVKEETDADERYGVLARDFARASQSGKSAVVVCATWRESDQVSDHIRAALKAIGAIGAGEQEVEVLRPRHLTEAHRSQAMYYGAGDVIVFRRKTRHFARGEHLVVVGTEGRFLNVRRPDGDIVPLDLRNAERFAVFAPKRIRVSAGDLLQLLENGRSANNQAISNGETVRAAAINGMGWITLEDGRTLGPHYRHFSLGYATTSQRAQGPSVDEVFIAIDGRSAFCATTTETFYVAASRGRRRLHHLHRRPRNARRSLPALRGPPRCLRTLQRSLPGRHPQRGTPPTT